MSDDQQTFRFQYGVDKAPTHRRVWLCSFCGLPKRCGSGTYSLEFQVCSEVECKQTANDTINAYIAFMRWLHARNPDSYPSQEERERVRVEAEIFCPVRLW